MGSIEAGEAFRAHHGLDPVHVDAAPAAPVDDVESIAVETPAEPTEGGDAEVVEDDATEQGDEVTEPEDTTGSNEE